MHASLKAQREALEFTVAGAAERVNRLNNLANAWWALYLSTGVLADLDEAVDTYAAAADCPGRPVVRAACLLGLGTARWDRWGRHRMPGDLDAAIVAFTSAAELVDEASPTAAHGALNLGAAYFARWRHLGQRADLDLAITHWTAAARSPRTRSLRPRRPTWVARCGSVMRTPVTSPTSMRRSTCWVPCRTRRG